MEKVLKQFIDKNLGEEKPVDPTYQFSSKLLMDVDNNFELPIHFLNKTDKFPVPESTNDDLELTHKIYPTIFKNNNEISNRMIQKWNKTYTNNVPFLKDSQHIIQNIKPCDDADHIDGSQLWDDINSPYYCNKYGFIGWNTLNFLNHSTAFLTFTTLSNMLSPLIFLIMPFIFLAIPFVLLKVQGIQINMYSYLDILKHIARNHFLGKAILNMQSASMTSIAQLVGYTFMYGLQIYNNVQSCKKYYSDIINVNTNINFIKKHISLVNEHIEHFKTVSKDCTTYDPFVENMTKHQTTLNTIYDNIKHIEDFKPSISKFADIGNVLKCYYNIYETPDYINSLGYSFGLCGYFNNLRELNALCVNKTINVATFTNKNKCKMNNQVYPLLHDKDVVSNTCDLTKNMIITGSNASGKTTILKATTINVILTQQFGFGYYDSCVIQPYTHIHSYLNIPDTSERDSLFQAESRRCKEILDSVENTDEGSRHFCIFDELYSGTNPDEASKSGYAFLKYLEQFKNVNFMLTTHYTYICKKFKTSECTANFKMHTTINDDGSLRFHYKIKKGISKIKGAINILKQMDYPQAIINDIQQL